jgi:endonuclease YncB( thermonuclease family)
MLERTKITSFVYPAKVVRVVDGDTVSVELVLIDVDLGFNVNVRVPHVITLRLGGINAPETSTDAGKVASVFLKTLLEPGTDCTVYTVKDRTEKYGRYLAWIHIDGDEFVNDIMIAKGHAIEYNPSNAKKPAIIANG